MIPTINGLRVHVTPFAIKTVGKVLVSKPWHLKRGYGWRIAKKWAKRFGPPKHEPTCYVSEVNQAIFIHPELWEKIKTEI